jgi:hypothetical protein
MDSQETPQTAGRKNWRFSHGVVGGMIAGIALGLAIASAGQARSTVRPVPGVSEQPHDPFAIPKYSREDFERLVKNKTPNEVLAIVGRPNGTSGTNTTEPVWNYYNITFDRISKTRDGRVFLYFSNGCVDRVVF